MLANFFSGFYTVELPTIGVHMHGIAVVYLWFLLEENRTVEMHVISRNMYTPPFTSSSRFPIKRKTYLPKCKYSDTALVRPVVKIGTILIKAMLLHFLQLGCISIFTQLGEGSPFRPERVKALVVTIAFKFVNSCQAGQV